MRLAPSKIYYSQDSISRSFGKSTDHSEVLIGVLVDKILTGERSIYDIKTIQVVFRNGKYITADNRRLWVFKRLEELGMCTAIPILLTSYISTQKSAIGLTIEVRGDPGGHFWDLWNERSSLSTEQSSDFSEPGVIIRLPPSKLCYSSSRIVCMLSTLKKDIKQLCTGQFPFTDVKIKAYWYENKYCATNSELLWKLRVAEKFQKCSSVKINVVAMPSYMSPYSSDDLRIYCEESYFLYDFRQLIRELPTLDTVHVNSSEIFYGATLMPDSYDGKSIVAALADFRKKPEALLVVKHGEELYSLNNRGLWIYKQIAKIERRPPKITVHIKMEMDYNMLRFFTSNYPSRHLTTVKFSKCYHHSALEKTFFDFLQREEDDDDDDNEIDDYETEINDDDDA